jgi:hypothetical protein
MVTECLVTGSGQKRANTPQQQGDAPPQMGYFLTLETQKAKPNANRQNSKQVDKKS